MSHDDAAFYIDVYLGLLEALHDARQDLTEASTEAGNAAMDALGVYVRAHPPKGSDFALIRGLLNHPQRTVRAMAGMKLLANNHREGWPAILEAATPRACPHGEPPGEAWRDFWAYMNVFSNLLFTIAWQSEEMDLRPTLAEVEDQWIAKGLTDRRILRLKPKT